MHGITDFTSDLIYSDESGAINESMSDIFAKGLEFFEDPDNFEWTIGHSFLETEFAEPFRSFVDPNLFRHPKMYNGQFWYDGGGVHTNSSVGNHWFYLLVNGGSAMNEAGVEYDIQGIGMNKALQIVFLTQTSALTPNSTYSFYNESSTIVAEELYGIGSTEALNVLEAWKAVGVSQINPQELEDELTLAVSIPESSLKFCLVDEYIPCLLYTSPSPRDKRQSRMPSSA